ncbi:MAG TPA: sensor histidine kinase [Anaerolineales bacterium]|nr:sensor histidine kinase [Anaerolineales bacterium]
MSVRTLSNRTMGTLFILVYNVDTMQSYSSPEIPRAARDPHFFTWLLTLFIGILYFWTWNENPAIRQPLPLTIFTALMVIHVILHWQIMRLIEKPKVIFWYILLQGLLVFAICWMGGQLPLIFALYLALLGETVGILGPNLRALLASVFYLLLAFINIQPLLDSASVRRELLGLAPLVFFMLIFVIMYRRQLEARQQAQSFADKLESANRQLAEYAARVEELTLTAERQRMARELHDTLSQGLTGLVLQLEAIKAHLEAGRGERAAEIIDHSLARARSTLAESRAAIDDLRSSPASLPEAIRLKTERFTQATGIPCALSLCLGDNTLPANTGDHLLSVLNEALANVTRHAQAGQIWVRLEAVKDHLELEIRDDGQGFDPETVTGVGHYGLLGMRERARLLDGTLKIESGHGQGTCIRLFLPSPSEALTP